MLGHGKMRRYELHHPMSLGDALAALFRRKPKKQQPETAELLLGLQPAKKIDGGEEHVAALLSCEIADSDRAMLK